MIPEVSVIIPTFNHREYVVGALESVWAQTLTSYEIIVINDGSPDDTREVLKPYVVEGRIRYVEQPNRGQAAARNLGLELARGKYVAYLDDDDLFPPDKLEWQVAEMSVDHNLGGIGGISRKIRADGTILEDWGGPTREVTHEELFGGNVFVSPGQALFRTALLREIGGFDHTIWGADDHDLIFRVVAASRLRIVDRVALLYRVHEKNASNDKRRLLRNTDLVLRKHLRPDSPAFRADRRRAYRWAYQYLGRALVFDTLSSMREMKWRNACRSMGALKCFLTPRSFDFLLFQTICADILPATIVDTLRWFRRSSRQS